MLQRTEIKLRYLVGLLIEFQMSLARTMLTVQSTALCLMPATLSGLLNLDLTC